jgi:murein DD-endopeptidase MepM/ murein hydrolase activator NlpD
MAHLPETPEPSAARVKDPLTETPLAEPDSSEHDPVVRGPKKLVELPPLMTYSGPMLVRVGAASALVGSGLAVAGLVVLMSVVKVQSDRMNAAHAHDAGVTTVINGSVALGQRDVNNNSLSNTAQNDGGQVVPTAVAPSELTSADGLVTVQQRLGRGHTLPQVLRALRVNNALATKVIASMRSLLNMRALQPSDIVAVHRENSGAAPVRKVEYRRGENEVISVTVDAQEQCTAERIRMVRTTVRIAAGFVVHGSLAETLRSAHLQSDIVPALQEVFTALELGREMHEGDRVRLVVNEDRLNDSFFRYGRIEALDFQGSSNRNKRAYWMATSARGAGAYYDAQGATELHGPLRAPVAIPVITSPFNPHRMHPVLHRVMPHQGTDFRAPVGTPIMAAADGTVTFRGWGGPTGNFVRLEHPQLGLETGYAHLVRFEPSVTLGTRVRVGQIVGYAGTTGRSTGPHLHWSVKRNGEFIDGAPYLSYRRTVPAAARAEFDRRVQQLNAELDGVQIAGTAQGGANTTAAP